MSSGLQLSLCAITRDEEARLPRLLASVEGLVDEIVIADTGSVDATVAIAERAGARVFPFEWCDDFSAAYNHALDHARGEWVLLLDADEEFLPGQESEVRRLIACEEAFAYTVLRRDYYGDKVREDGYTEMLQTRLFRNRQSVRFMGRIHQQLEPRLTACAQSEGRRTIASSLRFRHDGYTGDSLTPKLDRTIRLVELELNDRPDSFFYLVELGAAKLQAGDPAGVEPLTKAAEQIASGREPIHPRSAALVMLLDRLLMCDTLPGTFPLTVERIEQIAEDNFPRSVPILWRRALRRFKTGSFTEAAGLLERILSLAETDSYCRIFSFRPETMRADAWLNLGVCYTRMTKFRDAARCFEKIKDDPERGEAAHENLKAIAKLRGKR